LLPKNIFWPGLFFALTLAMFIAVPRQRIEKLLPIGLVAGFGTGIVFLSLLVPVFGFWGFPYPGAFSVYGFSLWAALAWIPVIVMFVEYLSLPDTRMVLSGYIAAFALAATLFVQWLETQDYLTFNGWVNWMTFMIALGALSFTAYAAFRTGLVRDSRLFKKD